MTKHLLLCALITACAGGSKLASVAAMSPNQGAAAYDEAPPRASVQQVAPEPVPDRPGLGTSWGEQVDAPIRYTSFVRASSSPWAEALLHYNDAEGVQAHAEYLRVRPEPIEMTIGDGVLAISLVDERGNELPGVHAADRTLVIGEDGERYRIVVRNGTGARFEIVTSVDGLDVVDGKPADPNRRGYLVDPHGTLVIDGFRTSSAAVAAFRFGKVSESYAAQTSGDRNVGVVGFAVFAERGAVWSRGELNRRDTADPFPDRGYATPPRS
jgi:hypothetical protein